MGEEQEGSAGPGLGSCPTLSGWGKAAEGRLCPAVCAQTDTALGVAWALVGLPRSRAVVLKLTDLGTLESFCFICGSTTLAEVLQVCTGNSDQLAPRWWTLHEKELSCKKTH